MTGRILLRRTPRDPREAMRRGVMHRSPPRPPGNDTGGVCSSRQWGSLRGRPALFLKGTEEFYPGEVLVTMSPGRLLPVLASWIPIRAHTRLYKQMDARLMQRQCGGGPLVRLWRMCGNVLYMGSWSYSSGRLLDFTVDRVFSKAVPFSFPAWYMSIP